MPANKKGADALDKHVQEATLTKLPPKSEDDKPGYEMTIPGLAKVDTHTLTRDETSGVIVGVLIRLVLESA